MRNNLIYLTLSWAALVALAWLLSSFGMTAAGRTSVPGAQLPVDLRAFSVGAFAGLVSVWLCLIPWARVPDMMLHVLLTWRRNLVLATLAVACTGVLLFY